MTKNIFLPQFCLNCYNEITIVVNSKINFREKGFFRNFREKTSFSKKFFA